MRSLGKAKSLKIYIYIQLQQKKMKWHKPKKSNKYNYQLALPIQTPNMKNEMKALDIKILSILLTKF
jgi:hypothetical protein